MQNQLLRLFFFSLFCGIWPQYVGAEMYRSAKPYEYYTERSTQNDTKPIKGQKWKKKSFRWKKMRGGDIFGVVLFLLFLIGSIVLIASGIGGGGAAMVIVGLLLSSFFLFLIIKAFKQKNTEGDIPTKEKKASKPPEKKGGMIVGAVFLVILAILFAFYGVIFLVIAAELGGGFGAVLLALLAFGIAALCTFGIARIAKKLKRFKKGYVPEADELPRRPPSRNLKHQ